MKQNAMTDAAKLQRRQDFIVAAHRLFLQQQRLPASQNQQGQLQSQVALHLCELELPPLCIPV